ncbi:Metallo-dependent phosphatase-like protein [Lactifluus subvellereus]|nr:Metallo-dependent phosphatase-like protein [Lactifluus subvellereus]
MTQYDPDKWTAQLMRCEHLPESDMKVLCDHVRAILVEESNIQPVSSPVTICDDIHGQFWDLLELLRKGGRHELHIHGTGTLSTEDIIASRLYLFFLHSRREECQQKYGSASVWKACCNVFDYLNLAVIIDYEVLCVHGGLSPDIRTLDQIHVLSRAQEIPHEGAFCDLMWSDPDDVENWAVSPRGAGWLFGGSVTREFNHVNSLSLIARAHQLVQEDYKYMFGEALATVDGARSFTVYGPAEENERDMAQQRTRRAGNLPYFV